MLVISTQLEAE